VDQKPLIQLLCGWTPNEEGSKREHEWMAWEQQQAMIDAAVQSHTPQPPHSWPNEIPRPLSGVEKKGRFQAELMGAAGIPRQPITLRFDGRACGEQRQSRLGCT